MDGWWALPAVPQGARVRSAGRRLTPWAPGSSSTSVTLMTAVAHADEPAPASASASHGSWTQGDPEVDEVDAMLERAASTLGAPPSDPPQTVVRQAMTRFIAAGIVALLLVSAGVWFAASRAAEREAIEDARQRTITLASALVQPELTQAMVDGDPAAQAEFAALVQERVLSDEVVRVKIWNRDGVIVWSDEPRLIGSQYSLGDEELEVIDTGGVAVAEASDLERPENRFDGGHGPLLEVYLPVWTPAGETLLFETYQTRTAVDARQGDVLGEFAPITIGGMVLLLLVLVPVAWSLARSLDRARAERMRLLQHALDASTTERRRIAAHLHDGIVQSLAGSSYALSGVADKLRSASSCRPPTRAGRRAPCATRPPSCARECAASGRSWSRSTRPACAVPVSPRRSATSPRSSRAVRSTSSSTSTALPTCPRTSRPRSSASRRSRCATS